MYEYLEGLGEKNSYYSEAMSNLIFNDMFQS